MEYRAVINGMAVTAGYSQQSVEKIFLPLLRKLTAMQRQKDGRLLVMLAAPPAAGKSTLVSFLEWLSHRVEDVSPVTAIGMDGFHRYQAYLLRHSLIRDGRELRMVDVKGAPETFDLEKLQKSVDEVASGKSCTWPDYDRLLHDPVEDARRVEGSIVILEGNYLLLEEPGWRELRQKADLTISILASEEDIRERLICRKMATGVSRQAAEYFVENSDLYNARRCLKNSGPADLTLRMTAGGEYVLWREGTL